MDQKRNLKIVLMSSIVIIGTGNTATILGTALRQAGHEIVRVAGRNISEGRKLAGLLNSSFTKRIQDIPSDSDYYIIAVNDDAIQSVSGSIPVVNGIVMHTSGSVSLNTIGNHTNYGVMYPLQTLKKERTVSMKNVPLLVEANNPPSLKKIKLLSGSLSENVMRYNSEQRLKVHLAAVVVNNFTNHLFTLAWNFLKSEKLEPSILLPLIRETVRSLEDNTPFNNQTGPARRNDAATVKKHLELLGTDKNLKKIYADLSKSIADLHNKKNKKKIRS